LAEIAAVVDLLTELVSIPSVNPRGRAVSAADPGEAALARYVTGWLTERGVQVSMHEALPGRPNVLGIVPGRRPELLVFEAHLDTVEVTGMTVDPFAATVRDGRMYGRGTCDAKGSLAAFLLALAELAAGEPPPVSVALAATADEEHHYRGVLAMLDEFAARGIDCVGAIVGEPTGLAMATAHRGVVRLTVRVQGRSGHTSRPEEALNAIALAAGLVERIETVPPTPTPHPLLGPAVRSVTRIVAGNGPNIIPGECEFDIDRRTLPGETPEQVCADLARELSQIAAEHVRADAPHTVDYPLDTEPDCPLVQTLGESLAHHRLPAEPIGVPFCSDASKFARQGIDAVVFGPGSIADAHTAEESVDLAEVLTATRLMVEVARSGRWSVS
jgi:acetylornithine deacetylase